eukprot:SAG31_NODE_1323_length_8792_cov_16.597032_3_plen_180_part_00
MAAGAYKAGAEYASATSEAMKTTDIRTLAADTAAGVGQSAAGMREAAAARAAVVGAQLNDVTGQARMRAQTLEARMRMEAATAGEYADKMHHKGSKIVKKTLKGNGPPTATEFIETLNKEAKSIQGGSKKGVRIAMLRKWAKELESDATYEEDITEPEPDPSPHSENGLHVVLHTMSFT